MVSTNLPLDKNLELDLHSIEDIVKARFEVRQYAKSLDFGLIDQTRIVTAASELARNTIVHGGGGSLIIAIVQDSGKRGIELTFIDHGKGIANIESALQAGHSTGGGLGLGLSGAKKLMHEFEINSEPNKGTKVKIIRWNYEVR